MILSIGCCREHILTPLRPRRNGRYNADDIFNWIFLKENVWIPIKISLKFVPKGPINNIPALVPMMAWRRPGDKPLSEPMLIFVPTHICVTRPQWVNPLRPSERIYAWVNYPPLVQIMACRLAGATPLSEPILEYFFIGPVGTNFSEILIKMYSFLWEIINLKMSSGKWGPFCLWLNVLIN